MLDGIVFGDKSLDFVHVGTIFVHRDGNHFDAVAFGDAEVAIVARHGAEPLYFRKLAPRRTAQIAVRVSSGYQVEHDVEVELPNTHTLAGSCSMTSPIKRFASAMPSMTP